MGKTFTLNHNGKTYLLRAWFEDCRDGFNHKAVLEEVGADGYTHQLASNKVHGINRLWEAWTFQSVLKGLLYNLEESAAELVKSRAKEFFGVKRMTPAVKAYLAGLENGSAQKLFDVPYADKVNVLCGEFGKQLREYNGY